MSKFQVIAIIGIVLIAAGMVINQEILIHRIEELNERVDQLATENIKLKEENNSLWDNYYMNASNYDGEYYE